MFSKIFFVLAMVCVVNASVLTVNVFDDDPVTQDASNPKDCNFQECDQRCRRLKFPGGACVNGRCKCDILLNGEDETENTLSYLEDSVLQKDDPEPEVQANPSRCNLKVCNKVCRWLNKTGGSCVDGRCKCSNSSTRKDDMTDSAEFLSPRSCNFRACDQQCFRFGYAGGSCINGRCKCGNFRITEDSMNDSAESLPLSTCNSIACDDQCRRTGWHSGVCVKGQCKCDYFLNTEDAVTGNTLSNLEDSISPKRCTYDACNELCRKHKFPGGTCVSSRCKCNNFFVTEDEISETSQPVSVLSEDIFFGTEVDAVDEYSELAERRICNLRECNQTCKRRGYRGGKCRVNGLCKCLYI